MSILSPETIPPNHPHIISPQTTGDVEGSHDGDYSDYHQRARHHSLESDSDGQEPQDMGTLQAKRR